MRPLDTDLVIVGAGPVGLLCAELARRCGLRAIVMDRSAGPLEVGRADALNARSLQLLQLAGLFDELYPLGKPCKTSSVWSGGQFVSRQSDWWDQLEGCFHRHFLMLGQAFLEKALDRRLNENNLPVRRLTEVTGLRLESDACVTTLASGETLRSRFVIGADGSRSCVRSLLNIPFELTRPRMIWAVIDAEIETDFCKVPEIIVFQAETSDVAWIPREGAIDRFYVRMDSAEFTFEDAVAKIERALRPHEIRFRRTEWFSRFSVKESVAERFAAGGRVFLAGDAAHVHSVNGGQGLNTGLADAFNLIWKLNMVVNHGASPELIDTYEAERKPVAKGVVETSAELVRATKYSDAGTHARDYVEIVRRRAGYITGMGIRYGTAGLAGQRLFDLELNGGRLYQRLNYTKYSLFIFGEAPPIDVPDFVQTLRLRPQHPYAGLAVLARPDAYIHGVAEIENVDSLLGSLK